MKVTDIRIKVHQYVDRSDDKLLKLMYALARDYNGDEMNEDEFLPEDIETFEQRTASRLTGESNTYNWQEAKQIVLGKSGWNDL